MSVPFFGSVSNTGQRDSRFVASYSIDGDCSKFLETVEYLLAIRSWYLYSHHDCLQAIPLNRNGDVDIKMLQTATDYVCGRLVSTINRGAGTNNWEIPKFVDLRLLPTYVQRLGPASIYNAGTGERGLKNWAKKPSKTSQKRGEGIFESQCASRLHDKSMIDMALSMMDDSKLGGMNLPRLVDSNHEVVKKKSRGTRFIVRIVQRNRRKLVEYCQVDCKDKKWQIPILHSTKLYLMFLRISILVKCLNSVQNSDMRIKYTGHTQIIGKEDLGLILSMWNTMWRILILKTMVL